MESSAEFLGFGPGIGNLDCEIHNLRSIAFQADACLRSRSSPTSVSGSHPCPGRTPPQATARIVPIPMYRHEARPHPAFLPATGQPISGIEIMRNSRSAWTTPMQKSCSKFADRNTRSKFLPRGCGPAALSVDRSEQIRQDRRANSAPFELTINTNTGGKRWIGPKPKSGIAAFRALPAHDRLRQQNLAAAGGA
jgi:hypothetical protein